MESFTSNSVQQLQNYLKERGVIFSNARKADLVNLCKCAAEVKIEVDPDGLLEDRNEVLHEKLCVENNISLPNPELLPFSTDLSILPPFSIFDIYNYLMCFDDYDHASLRDYYKMEGYTMFMDGYVLNVQTVVYDLADYVALKAKVKPRTCDKDPVTKLSFYRCWVIMKKSRGVCIHSAYCTCKGGVDGCCRHIVAVLFEVLDFIQDFGKASCTSKSCTWVRRATEADRLTQPVPVADLDTSVQASSSFQSPRPKYSPLPDENQKPNPDVFFNKVQQLYPKACMLKSKFINTVDDSQTIAPLTVSSPFEKLKRFLKEHVCITENCNCANIFIFYNLCYTSEQCDQIEISTRGQSKNNNWHIVRKGLITASVFHQVCCSTDLQKTADCLLKGGLNENSLPPAILFGRQYETKARNMFIKGHRFRHRQCSIEVPGFVIFQDSSYSMLGCSPDGIVNCKYCGKFLVEVKCSFKYKCFHPKTALKLSKICVEDENKDLVLNRSHKYFDQVQGQMAVTGITKCKLVLYTHKGIAAVDTDFDTDFWDSSKQKLLKFYKDAYFPLMKRTLLDE